jgi:YHS domain-containing protein
MKNRATPLISLAIVGLLLGCQRQPDQETRAHNSTPGAAAALVNGPEVTLRDEQEANALTRITDPGLVCMVNNQFMGKPQIPIKVDGRTYYGCCEMCKERLGSDPSSRVSTDPVTGTIVDKASAIIGKTSDGSIVYFENEQTFAAYAPSASR